MSNLWIWKYFLMSMLCRWLMSWNELTCRAKESVKTAQFSEWRYWLTDEWDFDCCDVLTYVADRKHSQAFCSSRPVVRLYLSTTMKNCKMQVLLSLELGCWNCRENTKDLSCCWPQVNTCDAVKQPVLTCQGERVVSWREWCVIPVCSPRLSVCSSSSWWKWEWW